VGRGGGGGGGGGGGCHGPRGSPVVSTQSRDQVAT